MTIHAGSSPTGSKQEPVLSLYHLLDPEVLANPYPLYHRLRSEDPVHWDPFLHAWVVTRYADVVHVFQSFSANRTPTPEQLTALGLSALTPLAKVMVLQMLFLDPPAHGRVRGLASKAFTPAGWRSCDRTSRTSPTACLDAVQDKGRMDVIADLAYPLACHRHRRDAWSAYLRLAAIDRVVCRLCPGAGQLPAQSRTVRHG